MEFQKILLERNIDDIVTDIILVWFGLYICPTKPKPIYGDGWAKRKGLHADFCLDPDFFFSSAIV